MVNKNNLEKFSIMELQELKDHIISAETKEELLEAIDEVIKVKEETEPKSMNERFPIDWMNIDPQYKQKLHDNGIDNLEQLRNTLLPKLMNGEIDLDNIEI